MDQRIRDVEYPRTMEYQGRAPLDLTEPRIEAELMEADNVMAAETRSTGCHYRHYMPEGYIRRDPEVKREGNDVTQATFQSPYSHSAPYYERMIYSRHGVRTVMFYRREEGAERGPVQRAALGRDNFARRAHRQENVRSRHVPAAGHDAASGASSSGSTSPSPSPSL
jgi:hypothetical protein